MLKIGVTGINGFVGSHIKLFFSRNKNVSILGADHDTFSAESKLDDFVSSVDVVIHLAGLNRGEEQRIKETNISLTKNLIGSLRRKKATPYILFSSSTQITLDNVYGESKRVSAKLLNEWASDTSASFANLIIPNLYGEWGKPFYNSVIATFCHQLANNAEAVVHQDNLIEFLYVQDLVREINQIISRNICGDINISGESFYISEILNKIQKTKDKYFSDELLKFSKATDINLASTYHSYLFPKFYPRKLSQPIESFIEGAVNTNLYNVSRVKVSSRKINLNDYFDFNAQCKLIILTGKIEIKVRRFDSIDSQSIIMDAKKENYIEVPKFYLIDLESLTDNGGVNMAFISTKIET